MNKFRDFFISNIIVVAFVILSVLFINIYIINQFSLNKEIYFVFLIALLLGGTALYYFLAKSIFDDMQRSNHEIDFLIKQTLHELNTPVATIKANLKMLKNKELDTKTIQRLDRIEFASDKLFELYEAMEYEIKYKIGKTTIEQFDIKELIDTSILRHQDLNKSISITNKVSTFFVACDRFGFQKTFDNLLSNAIKYNIENGVVSIELIDKILSIKDSGKGIETKNLFTIFEAYFQEDNNKSGFGIGLAIVKKFCDDNKIKIAIESDKNGSTFYLDLKNISY